MLKVAHGNSRTLQKWEKRFILERYGKWSIGDMAEYIGVSKNYIRDRATELGLHTSREKRRGKPIKFTDIRDVGEKLAVGKIYKVTDNTNSVSRGEGESESFTESGERIFEGRLISLTPRLAVFDRGKFKECVQFVDLLTGAYQAEEM